jgi:hypothetical protein
VIIDRHAKQAMGLTEEGPTLSWQSAAAAAGFW